MPDPCYLCGGSAFNRRKGEVRDAPAIAVLECRGCGLVMLDSRGHIRPGHYEHSHMHGEAPAAIESVVRECAADDRRRFEALGPLIVNRRVLDVGCGCGGFLRHARALAGDVAGVELEVRMREFLASTIPVHATIDPLRNERFDLITAFHVIEHLADPRTMLIDLGGLLADRGRIVVEVPSADDALLTLYECAAFQKFTYWSNHLFLFNGETLRRLGEQAGLRVVAVEQVQRYPLSNHLFWLSAGKPGGHQRWPFLDSAPLRDAYGAALAAMGKCDTIVAHLERGRADG